MGLFYWRFGGYDIFRNYFHGGGSQHIVNDKSWYDIVILDSSYWRLFIMPEAQYRLSWERHWVGVHSGVRWWQYVSIDYSILISLISHIASISTAVLLVDMRDASMFQVATM